MPDRPRADEDPATGEPLGDVLEELHEPPSAEFLLGIRRRIHRRALAGQVIDLVWTGPALVLIQWLRMLLAWLGPQRAQAKEGDVDDE